MNILLNWYKMDNFLLGILFITAIFLQRLCAQDTASQYIGCYKDDESNQAMSIISGQSVIISIRSCLDFCKQNKYTFSGLKSASECHCGEDFARHGTSDSCNRECTDNSGDICGGDGVLSVYSTCPQGHYGTNCERMCPYTCITLDRKTCHLTSGKCCDATQSIPYCKFFDTEDCGAVDGDPRVGVSSMPARAGTWLNFFKTLSFPIDAEVHKIEYYTNRGGDTEFVSVWRHMEGDDYMMVAKLELSPTEAGVQNLTLSSTQRIYVQQGDAIALHYPSSNTEADMIPYAKDTHVPKGISSSDLHILAATNIRGDSWRPGYTRNMDFYDVKRTPAIALKYHCIKECVPGKYGSNCTSDCYYCNSNDTCHFVDGTCPDGCINGYKGFKCDEECDENSYGQDCAEVCGNCMDNLTCHHISGHCDNGCSDGYQGVKCTEACTPGQYGLNCAGVCVRCRDNELCDHVTGKCTTGCEAGYYGDLCNATCQDNTYGFGCQPCSIHCAILPCDKFSETGSCSGNCESGYTGENCMEECQPGKYGPKCRSTCYGNCLGSCDIIDGVCKDGCIDGWTGQMCDIRDASESGSTMIVAIAVVVGCIVVVLIVTVGVVYARRTKANKSRSLDGEANPTFTDIAKASEYDQVADKGANKTFSQVNDSYEMIGARDNGQSQYESLKDV